MEKDKSKKQKKNVLWEMAEKCAGVAYGEKIGRWTHEDRVVIVYSVLCALARLNKKVK